MSAPNALPSRLVTADHTGWWLVGGLNGDAGYVSSALYVSGGDPLSLDQLNEQHGPLRPVEPITDADRNWLEQLIEQAGRKAVYSLAVAVYRTINWLRDDAGGFDIHDGDLNHRTHETAMRQIRAGRPGSWEAQQITDVAFWAGHGKPSRIHEAACASMAAVLYGWCTNPDRFTEVAENLAAVVSGYADEHGGWKAVADQWLQPGALDQEGVRLTYGLFGSLMRDFDPSALG